LDIEIPSQIEGLETIKEFNDEIIKHSQELIDMAQKIIPFGDISARDMIDENTASRYISVNKSILMTTIAKGYSEFEIEMVGMLGEEIDLLMLSWIALGSALESSLQIFLTAFKHNYDDNPAQRWDIDNEDALSQLITEFTQSIKEQEILSTKNANSFRNEIKKVYKRRMNGLSIERITLSDLLNYFKTNVWNNNDYFEVLESIRDNRNVIHSFSDREIGSWSELEYAIRIYITCLIDLKGTMSYLESIVDDMISDYNPRDYS